MSNGVIKDLDGVSDLVANLSPGVQYYIVIRHRNHLDVMSAMGIQRNVLMNYNFSGSTNNAYGINQLKNIGTVAVLFAGDIGEALNIQGTDNTIWESLPAVINEYH